MSGSGDVPSDAPGDAPSDATQMTIPLRAVRSPYTWIVATLAAAVIIENIVGLTYGTTAKDFPKAITGNARYGQVRAKAKWRLTVAGAMPRRTNRAFSFARAALSRESTVPRGQPSSAAASLLLLPSK